MPDFSPKPVSTEIKCRIMHNVVALVSDHVHSAKMKSIYIPVLENAGLTEIRPSIEYVHGLPMQRGEGLTYFQNYGIRLRYDLKYFEKEEPHYICATSESIENFIDDMLIPEYILAVRATDPNNSPDICRMFGEAMMLLETREHGFMLDARDPNNIYQAYVWISTIVGDIERKQNEPQRKA